MANSKRRNDSNSAKKLTFYAVLGIVLIALAILSFMAVLGLMKGNVFTAIRRVMQGLGGGLSIAISLLLAWGGVISVLSVGRSVPKRGLFLVTVVYLSVLGIINLLSYTDRFDYMEYIVWYNNNEFKPPLVDPTGYWNMITSSYKISSLTGSFGGALGMLLGWPAWTFLKTVFGTAVLALLGLICIIFFAGIDLRGMFAGAKQGVEERRQSREAERAREAYERLLEERRHQEEEAERLKLTPAYKRRKNKTRPEEAAAMQPQQPPYPMYPNAPVQQAAPIQYGYPAQPVAQPMPPQAVYPDRTQQPEMYDELIAAPTTVLPFTKASGKAKKGKKGDTQTAYQTRMTFTPREMGYVEPDPEVEELAASAKSLGGSTRKALEKLEDIRRRKAALAMEISGNELAAEETSSASAPVEELMPQIIEPMQPANQAVTAEQVTPEQPYVIPPQPPVKPTAPDRDGAYKRPASEKPVTVTKQDNEPVHEPIAYSFPSIDLLNTQQQKQTDTRAMDTENAHKLEKTLESFGIPARVQRVTHGPAVTRFELGLVSSGINVKRILGISNNIALDMAANGGVRIEIPIPGTNLFGIEVPNAEKQSVTLAEVLTSPEMRAAKSPLAVALGRDIAGKPIICDLAKMPHLLIAGQTGSGKSVCINSIINSLLYRSTPDEVRMIMIDPKVVELQCYNVVPHLLIPVVSDPHKAAGALAWAVAEMLDRYHKMQTKKAREIDVYNSKLEPGEPKLPRIVIIIDELADLMMACKKEVEESIIRIAQLARAAGIHMVVATQRPTVDVITGLIKSNVPSRIAFAVSSNTDSRTILDDGGAEKLLGRGDMLYMPTGVKPPMRVQGCFLSDAETERVADYIAEHSSVEFDPNVIEAMENDGEVANPLDADPGDSGVDDRLAEAIEMVITDGQASISMLQRRMKLGYARAGRIIDDMAARGIVSKSVGSKPREVLMTREEYERIKDSIFGK